VQELRQWQREWRDDNRAKTFTFIGDRRISQDDKPSTPPPENKASVDDNAAELPHTEDTEDKADEKENIQHADDTTTPTENIRLDSTCCS